MKFRYTLLLSLVVSSFLFITAGVLSTRGADVTVMKKGDGTNDLTANLAVGTGKSLTIDSGGSLILSPGSTFNFSGGIDWASITNTPTTLAGYGITNGAATNGSYADPAWITSLAATKLTGTIAGARMPAFSGDASSSAGGVTLTLASVNGAPGTIGDSSHSTVINVDAKGRVLTTSVPLIAIPSTQITDMTAFGRTLIQSGNAATAKTALALATVATTGSYPDLINKPTFPTLSPLTTLGDTLYEDATPTPVRLPGNTTTTRKFYRQVGNGSLSAAPAWDTLVIGDLPTVFTGRSIDGGTNTLTNIPLSSVVGSLGVAQGGTGFSSYTNGQLLIGNTTGNTLARNTLGSSQGVSITNGAGTITVGLGAITPTSVNTVVVSGSSTPTLAVTGTSTISGTNTGDQTSVTGNAGTATALQNARTINGVSFNGTANITVPAAAGTLTGTALAANVVTSSLTGAAGGAFGTAAYANTTAFEVPLTFTTGLTRATNTITVNTTQNISRLSNLTTNGFVTTSGANGTLGVDTTTYAPTASPTFTGTITFPGSRQTFVPGATQAGLNVGSVASNPSVPTNGDLWYNSTGNVLNARIGGTTVALSSGTGFATISGTPSAGQIASWTSASAIQGVAASTLTGNPTTSIGLSVSNGTASTFMRSDGAPALSQAITPFWTAQHNWEFGSGGTVPTALNAAQTPVRFASAGTIEGANWANVGAALVGRVAGGVRATPAATPADQALTQISGTGYDTAFSGTLAGQEGLFADGLWSVSNHGTYWTWQGTPNGSTTMATWMTLRNNRLSLTTTTNFPALNIGGFGGDPGTLANGDIWYNSSTNILKARVNGSTVSLGSGTGTVTNTAGALTASGIVIGNGSADVKVVTGLTTDGVSKVVLGVAGGAVGSVDYKNATSGTINVAPVTGALGTSNLLLPAVSSTIATIANVANPTGTVGTAAVNGSATTFMRSDGAPAINLTMAPTMTGLWTFSNDTTLSGVNGTAGHGVITGPSVAGKGIKLQSGNTTGFVDFRDSGGNRVGAYDQSTDSWSFAKPVAVTSSSSFTTSAPNVIGSFGYRNRLINGNMLINQANVGTTVTVNSNTRGYSLDQWSHNGTAAAGVFTIQQSTSTPPADFPNFMRLTVTTADASPAAGSVYYVGQPMEGNNIADLNFGLATAKTVTLSFWVRSSLTGSFSGNIMNGGGTRSYPFSFTIASANTWQKSTVSLTGDTTGTWAIDNNTGIWVFFDVGSGSSSKGTAGAWAATNLKGVTGSVNLIATNTATYDLTGVQFEPGNAATAFEIRDFDTEFHRCQRYFEKSFRYPTAPQQNAGVGAGEYTLMAGKAGAATNYVMINYKVAKRLTNGTIVTLYNPAAANAQFRDETATADCSAAATAYLSDTNATMSFTGNASTVAGNLIGFHWIADARM